MVFAQNMLTYAYFPTDAIVDDSEMAKMTLVCAFPTSSKSYVFE